MVDIRNDMLQRMFDTGARTSFAEHQHDGVVSGYRPDDFVKVAAVDVVGQAACVSGARLDDGNVGGEFDREESIVTKHLGCTLRISHALVHRIVGKHVYIVAVHTGGFGYLQLLQVT